MQCTACGHANRSGRRFCAKCGAPLTVRCGACGAENEPGDDFCSQCGLRLADHQASQPDLRSYTPKHLAHKILNARSALEGERKQVTVLFVDVKESMELAQQVDAEEWHRIMDGFFQVLTGGVHRFEGTVNQYTGDGIMALFGAPIAHEDHAQRACAAALYLQEQLRDYAEKLRLSRGLRFAVRMGLNSGEVVVGKIGDDLRMDYTALGHTVGLASRMEQLADPGAICLSEHTARLVSGFFQLRDLGRRQIKGVREPLGVFVLEAKGALRTRLDASRARGFSPFVGREDEMGVLEAALARAGSGQTAVLGIVGEAGTGKSRLCYEFLERCRARGVTVFEAHGAGYAKLIPYLPILELFRGFLGLTEQDGDQVAREKITERLLSLDPAFRDVLPLAFEFMGVGDPAHPAPRMDPEARQRQLLGLVKRVAESARRPTVILLEDLSWFDPSSEAFVDVLAEARPTVASLLLVTFRPGHRAPWMQRADYHQLALAPLSSDATMQLLGERLGDGPETRGLRALIQERTGGNPFFIEEVIQSLLDQGVLIADQAVALGAEPARGLPLRLTRPVSDIQIPPTVQAVLAARIDRLPEREKTVLQAAAVIGKRFTETVLAQVAVSSDLAAPEVAAALRTLTATEFLYREAFEPVAEYVFKHPLTQEIAYQSQLGERRAEAHAAVAAAIAQLAEGRLDEQAAVLAHHWERAGNGLEAARWHRRAAQRFGYGDPQQAFRHWTQVRALAAALPALPEANKFEMTACLQLLSFGWRQGLAEAEAERLFTRGRELIRHQARPDLEARLVASYGRVLSNIKHAEAFLAHAMEALDIARATGNDELVIGMESVTTQALCQAGQLRESIELNEHVLERAKCSPQWDASFGFSLYRWLRVLRAQACVALGRLDDAEADLTEVVERAAAAREVDVLVLARYVYVELCWLRADVAQALPVARDALSIAEQLGSTYTLVMACGACGFAHLLNDQPHEAVSLIEKTLSLARDQQVGVELKTRMLVHLAEARLRLGDIDEARAASHAASEEARRRRAAVLECQAQLAHARVLLRDGSVADATVALERAAALVQRTGAQAYAPFIHRELAEVARRRGVLESYREELAAAERLFTEMGAYRRASMVRDAQQVA